ncbi:glutamate mutase L [Thermanaerothrix sp. 4228-RoL]|uniref:Glutamate mutase L n=1 Tax=Thermanaerothrix solaris TaxID=3058434 RepID=A0ABU3NR96_9CHLR|nr:glutamate mutase L [Thermanaerothrix sp. 4228-RoL]MDT8899319.1 glutamate mutase L [Thermanaerothrix sp. 4228-RoL]
MSSSIVEAESILAVDIGSVFTRALLFDVVEERYRMIATAQVRSTIGTPYFDISESIFLVLTRLEEITGRHLMEEAHLILPAQDDGSGVDRFVLTFSAGQPLRVVAMGLLEDVSLASARKALESTYCQIVEQIGLNDRRKPEAQIDAILRARPDLVLIAGGTDQGATRSMAKLVDLLVLALQLLPPENRPDILYAGNTAITKQVADRLEPFVRPHVVPNVRPNIDQENLLPAQEKLSEIVYLRRSHQLGGLQSYSTISSITPQPSLRAFGRMVQFLSKLSGASQGVLGIDLGSATTGVAFARQDNFSTIALPYGSGYGLAAALEQTPLESITRWLPMHAPDETVRDYLWHRTLYPASVPHDLEYQAIEQAMLRQILALVARRISSEEGIYGFEPILVSGYALTQALSPAQALLTLLDGLQPIGVTTFILDPYGLVTALGAIAPLNPTLVVQTLESNALLNLGTVIAPISAARYGTPVLNVRYELENGETSTIEVRQGTVIPLPIPNGQRARLHLHPLRPLRLTPDGKDTTRSFRITGGLLGAVIDARGRPLELPTDSARRRDLLKRWMAALGS